MTDYYVKNAGDNGYTGQSDAQAWETIAYARTQMSNEDNLYFKCGDTWYTRTDSRLDIEWGGVDINNKSIVGSYYMDGGVETVGVNADGKPVLDGGWDLSTFEADIRRYENQVYVKGSNNIIVQDLKVINSHGYGVNDDSVYPNTNVIIRRVEIWDTGRAGIRLFYSGSSALVEYCKVMRDNRQYFIGESWNWDSGIRIKGDNCISRYNEVGNGWGEGIGVSQGGTSYNVLVENNLVWGRQSVGIYLGCCTQDGIVRNNVVLGTTNTDYHKSNVYKGRTWNATGIGFNMEKTGHYTHRNKVYNNVVIGCSNGMHTVNLSGGAVGTTNRNYFHHNTLIDNRWNYHTHVSQLVDIEFKNNLSIQTSEGTTLGCEHIWTNQNVSPTGVYRPLGNMWSSTPEFSQWQHANDVIGDPGLAISSGWLSISVPSDIDIAAAFALTATSDAIDTAQDLGATYNSPFITGSDFNPPDASDADTPIVVVTGDQDDYGTGWDFGAFAYSESNTPYTRMRGINRPKTIYGKVGRRFWR